MATRRVIPLLAAASAERGEEGTRDGTTPPRGSRNVSRFADDVLSTVSKKIDRFGNNDMTRSRNDGDVFANYRYQFIFIDKIARSCIIRCNISVTLQFFFFKFILWYVFNILI